MAWSFDGRSYRRWGLAYHSGLQTAHRHHTEGAEKQKFPERRRRGTKVKYGSYERNTSYSPFIPSP
jgi:hypothetical protein